jgi:hypothetical protein
MTIAAIHLLAARFFSTHHASAADVLAGRERPPALPAYELLVGRARRFTSLVTQLHLEVAGPLHAEAGEPPIAVFATREGEIQTAEKLIADLRESSILSSARFALSVHNTASGLYSVATGSTAPATTVTGANALAAGWLEAALTALAEGRPVLLSVADEPVPAVFQGPRGEIGVAAAFLLAAAPAAGRPTTSVQLAVTPCAGDAEVDALHALARAADAWQRGAAVTVPLGRVQPDAMLELHLLPPGARA